MYPYKQRNRENFLDQREIHEGKYSLIVAQEEKENPCREGTGDPNKPNYFFKNTDGTGDYFVMYTGQKCQDFGDDWRKKITTVIVAPLTRITLRKEGNLLHILHNENNRRWEYNILPPNTPIIGVHSSNSLRPSR
jgi:hypothetical protein